MNTFPFRVKADLPTERWMVKPEDVMVGDIILVDYAYPTGLTAEKVTRSEPGDGRHGSGCDQHWTLAFEGRSEVGHCYVKASAGGSNSYRRVIVL